MRSALRGLAAALVAVPTVAVLAAPTSAHADPRPLGVDESVSWGPYYEVRFHHTGPKGETLEVFDRKSDGYAAVAYVEFESGDTDRFVMSTGYREYNLRDGDSGEYDVPENQIVEFMVCRGYKSIPGDNCSVWDLGIS